MKKWSVLGVFLCAWAANAQPPPLKYVLAYSSAGVNAVQVRIDLASPRSAPVVLVMPRNYGGYEFVPYDSFVEDVRAFSDQGKPVAVKRAPIGPRWLLGNAGEKVVRLEYSIDVVRMEKEILRL